MTVSASDTPTSVIVSKNGTRGVDGTNGTDGVGFNGVRKTLIDNPLSYLYKKNNIVETIKQFLTVDRNSIGAYTDIYGVSQNAPVDTPREEVEGWLITSTETHAYDVQDNIPLLSAGFSCVFRVGSYSAGAVSQDVLTIPSTTGNLFVIGTDGLGNWITTVKGSDLTDYDATTVISATSSSEQVLIVTYTAAGVLNININDALVGTVTVTPGNTDTIDTTGSVELSGNITINIHGLRFYDFILNADEITYLNN